MDTPFREASAPTVRTALAAMVAPTRMGFRENRIAAEACFADGGALACGQRHSSN